MIDLAPEEVITEVEMSCDGKAWIFLEGETDLVFFRSRLNERDLKFFVAGNRDNVLMILKNLLASRKHFIGIIDRDYDDYLQREHELTHLVVTESRDMENMFFSGEVLQRVMEEFASRQKTPSTVGGRLDVHHVRDVIYKISTKIGKLRICNDKYRWGISFKDMDYDKFILRKQLDFDADAFLKHLNGKNNGKISITEHMWQKALNECFEGDLNRSDRISHGHDLMNILCISLKCFFGNCKTLDKDTLESIFRLGYSGEELYSNPMWRKILDILKLRNKFS